MARNQYEAVTDISFPLQVRKFVVRREVQPKKEGAKPYTKAPCIQRLVTPQRLQRKRHLKALKRRQSENQKEAAVRSPGVQISRRTILTKTPG